MLYYHYNLFMRICVFLASLKLQFCWGVAVPNSYPHKKQPNLNPALPDQSCGCVGPGHDSCCYAGLQSIYITILTSTIDPTRHYWTVATNFAKNWAAACIFCVSTSTNSSANHQNSSTGHGFHTEGKCRKCMSAFVWCEKMLKACFATMKHGQQWSWQCLCWGLVFTD